MILTYQRLDFMLNLLKTKTIKCTQSFQNQFEGILTILSLDCLCVNQAQPTEATYFN